MATYSAGGGNDDFKRVSPGTHVAICTMIADVGIQPGGNFGPKHKVLFRFETPEERVTYKDKDGNDKEGPLTITERHTASMNKKALMRKMLESWRGATFTDEEAEAFDVRKVLGQACLIGVVENEKDGKTYSNISNVMKLPKGTAAPKAENPLLYYGPDDNSQYAKLPPWVQKLIDNQMAPEKAPLSRQAVDEQMANDRARDDDFSDEIPF